MFVNDDCSSESNVIIISAVICTHNRAELLGASITSLFEQTFNHSNFEIIVVNNASRDDTQLVMDVYASRCPASLTYRAINEPRLGLSFARNTGLKAARGRYVAFLDDDAIANPSWLAELVQAFAQSSQIAAVGGPIHPIWPSRPPKWITPRFHGYYTILDFGLQGRRIDPRREWLGGANIAFNRQALSERGGFSTELGRQGNNLLSNEETNILRRLADDGYHCWYSPAAHVRHHIHPDRVSRRWLLRRCFWQGVSNVAMDQLHGGLPDIGTATPKNRARLLGRNLPLIRRIMVGVAKDVVRMKFMGRRNTHMESIARNASRLGTELAPMILRRLS